MKNWLLFSFLLTILAPAVWAAEKNNCDDAFLGVYSKPVSEEKAEILGLTNSYGHYVTRVLGNTAAESAGIRPFDYIYGLNEKTFEEEADLSDRLRDFRPGDEVDILIFRDQQPMRIPVVLTSRDQADYDSPSRKAFLGVSPAASNGPSAEGVQIKVHGNSVAEQIGLQDGDRITAINGFRVVDWQDVKTAIEMTPVESTIEVAYNRDGQPYNAAGLVGPEPRKRYAGYPCGNCPEESVAPSLGARVFLGIYLGEMNPEKAAKLGFENKYGIYVKKVIPQTAAERAGLQPFDYIYGIDEYRMGEEQSLGMVLSRYEPGQEAEILFIRQGKERSAATTFGRREEAMEDMDSDPCEEPFLGVRSNHRARAERGVGISVVSNSTASDMGLQDGDIITAINGYPLIDWSDLGTAVDNTKVGTPIKIEFKRGTETLTLSRNIQSKCDRKNNSGSQDFDFDFDYDYDEPDFGFDFNPEDRPPLRNVRVEMKPMTKDDAREVKEKFGLDMPVDNNLRISSLQLFPNPSNGMFNLKFNLPDQEDTSIRIFNSAGRLIYRYDLMDFQGEFQDGIDISQNGPGVYFLEVRQKNKTVTRKVILTKS